jgi:antitoxin (DNA-binding transcriptional repressor) of toxin-antitoxin stability system
MQWLLKACGVRFVYATVRVPESRIVTRRVGIREFRERLASFLLESEEPVAITRHGDTVGYYVPTRQRRSETERTALKEAASRLQQALTAEGISEEELPRDFDRWRRGERK